MKPNSRSVPGFLALSLVSSCAIAQPEGFWLSINSNTYSSISPIKQLMDDMQGPVVESGSYAYSHTQFELGERRENLELYLLARRDDLYQFTNQTAQYLYYDKNDLPIPDGYYPINLEVNSLQSLGLGLGYYFDLTENFRGRAAINYLHAKVMTDGSVTGSLDVAAGSVSGNLAVDYAYTEDTLFGRAKESHTGQGYSIDFDLEFEPSDRYSIALQGRDVWSAIYWNDQTTTQANTVTRVYNLENGASLSLPGIVGYERNEDYTQKLPSRILLTNSYRLSDNLNLLGDGFWYGGNFQAIAGTSYTAGNNSYSVRYNVDTESLSLGYVSDTLSLNLGIDNLDPDKAQALQISASYHF